MNKPLSFTLSAKHLSALRSLGISSIGVDTPSLNGLTGFVGIDEEATMRSSLKALLRLGHSAIAYVGGGAHTRFSTSTPTRELAFLSAVEAENLDSSHCPVINDYKTPQEVALVLQNPATPSVICVENDALAAELYKEFTRLGVKLPEDLSLIGFDDQELASIIDLSTIRQDPTALGKEAVNLVVSVLSCSSAGLSPKPQGSLENKKILTTELILRSTLGPGPQ